jgi:type I restriction enzyme S subunit
MKTSRTNWLTLPIKDIYTGLYDGPHATPRPAVSGPIFLGIKNVTEDGQLDLVNVRHIAEDEFADWTRRVQPRANDLVFTYEATLNRYALIPEGFRGCLGRRMALIRPNPEVVDVKYLFYYFFTDEWRSVIRNNMLSGSTVDRIPLTGFPDFPVRIPSLPIQRRIAGILSAYDDLIENSQRRIKILEEMARRLYREWFVHFRFPGHEDCQFVESPLGEIPEGWEVKKLAGLMTDHIGGGWGKEAPDDDHTEPAWVIRGTDIPSARISQVTGVPHRYHTASNLRSRKLASGDILFEVSGGSKGQPVGRTLLMTPELLSALNGDAICASFCKRVRPDANGYGAELLYLSFLEGYESGEIEQFQVQSTGISNFKWTEYIDKTQRVVPPDRLRSRFREQVAAQCTQIAMLGMQIQNLRRTRDLLLPRLLSGQIDLEALPEPGLTEP